MRRFSIALALYVFGYLPLLALLMVLEGAAYGRWGLSARDWEYQLSGFVAFMSGWLLIAAPFAAAILCWLLTRIDRVQSGRRKAFAALAGFLSVFLGACGVAEGAAAVGQGSWGAPIALALFPVALLIAGIVYGLASSLMVGRHATSVPPLRQMKPRNFM